MSYYDPIRQGYVNDLGEFVPNEYADYWNARIQQAQLGQQSYANMVNGLGSLGNYSGNYAIAASPVYLAGGLVIPSAPSVVAKSEDECGWLRRRVEEVCWRAA